MSKVSREEQDGYTSRYRKLITDQQTLLLSTVSVEGMPEGSYAPYVKDQKGVFYIYVSDLASHANNMLQIGRASVLFIQAEKDTQNLFARARVVLDCTIIEIKPTDDCYEQQLLAMKHKFGETVDLLRSLTDFHLLALKPVSGKYIAGFGQAYKVNTAEEKLNFD